MTTDNSIQFPGKDYVARAVEIAGWVPWSLPNLERVVAELGDSNSLGVMWSLAVIDSVVANSKNKLQHDVGTDTRLDLIKSRRLHLQHLQIWMLPTASCKRWPWERLLWDHLQKLPPCRRVDSLRKDRSLANYKYPLGHLLETLRGKYQICAEAGTRPTDAYEPTALEQTVSGGSRADRASGRREAAEAARAQAEAARLQDEGARAQAEADRSQAEAEAKT